ncbi:ashwin-like, partial [Scleropages formosus]
CFARQGRAAAKAAGNAPLKMAGRLGGREGKGSSGAQGKGVSDVEVLLHPELLSQDFVGLVLQQKKIRAGDDGEAARDHLMELFFRHVTPKPQRELPDSRWGRRVERSGARQTSARAGAHSSSSSGETSRKRPLIVFDGTSTSTGTVKLKKPEGLSGSGATDRLKPPPSGNVVNTVRKLSSSPVDRSSSISSPKTHVSSPGATPKSPAPMETARSHVSSTSGGAAGPGIKLKRQATSEGESDSPGEMKSPEVKKKIQHITWP